MCYNHGKIIDTDESRFTIDLLKKWKEIAESLSRVMVETGCSYDQALLKFKFSSLAANCIDIFPESNENELIGDAICDSCISIAWGKEIANSLRDFIIEHTRNSFAHGNATSIKIDIKKNRFNIIDNGNAFNPRELLRVGSNSGGVESIKYLFTKFSQKIVFSHERIDNLNIVTIAFIDSSTEIFDITPCSIAMSRKDINDGSFSINVRETCTEVFIVLPRYFSPSDAGLFRINSPFLLKEKRQLIFVTEGLSDSVLDSLERSFPNCQIIKV